MLVQIQNIEFNFRKSGNAAMGDTENLGLASLIISGPMTKRFAKECGGGIIPHYEEEESREAKGSEHDCYNTDTQIVLMHWLFKKRRKYKLPYFGIDPFWLFHDSLHAQNDVYGNEVGGIYSHIEKQRLLDGAKYAHENGVHISADSVIKIGRDWRDRWAFREGESYAKLNTSEFYKFMEPDQVEIAEFWLEIGADDYKTPFLNTFYG